MAKWGSSNKYIKNNVIKIDTIKKKKNKTLYISYIAFILALIALLKSFSIFG